MQNVPSLDKQPTENQAQKVNQEKDFFVKTKSTQLYIFVAIIGALVGAILSVFVIWYLYGSEDNTSALIAIECAPTATPGLLKENNEFVLRIDPERTEIINDKLVASFLVTNLNEDVDLTKVTYWTDKQTPCDAITDSFYSVIKVPVDDVKFSFFTFEDSKGNTSQIYASSHNPIFQCGNLAE